MVKRNSLNLISILFVFLLIIFGQILWLFDPIRIGSSIYWIDIIQNVVYLVILLPLIWLVSALIGLIQLRRVTGKERLSTLQYLLVIIRLFIILGSTSAAYTIALNTDQYIWLAISLAAAWLFTLLDMVLEEWSRFDRFPMRNLSYLMGSIGLTALMLWPTSYMVTYPGLTLNMNQYAEVDSGNKQGNIAGVLIFERPAFPVDWLYAQWFPYYKFDKKKKTDLPLDEQLQRARVQKLDANQIASAVAFEKVGIGQGFFEVEGTRVAGLLQESPAAEQLEIGDVIIKLNGQSIEDTSQFIQHLRDAKVHDVIQVTLLRNQEKMVKNIQMMASPKDPNAAIMGVQIIDEIELDLPLAVKFHPYLLHEGGPSHGAMLSLALIDQLTPGGVTKGIKVAGTGTIDIHGNIGNIGGIRQKAHLVERAGADVFFVPKEQLTEARKGASWLNIVPVNHLGDILRWLEMH